MTSDITKGNVRVSLKSYILPKNDSTTVLPMAVDPEIVKFKQDERDKVHVVTVTNLSEVPLTPKLVSAPHEYFEVNHSEQVIKPGKSIKMKFHVMKGTKAKTAKKSFTFELNDAKRTRFTIPVQLVVENKQAIKPTPLHKKGGK